MNTLETISGIRARIFELPNRPPFMLAADLAEVYGSRTDLINAAVTRNPARFPERYSFLLSEGEIADLKTQNALSSRSNRAAARAFTHGGANMLSGVLKSKVADEMAVAINDAFSALEAQALSDVQLLLQKVRSDARNRKPVRARIVDAKRDGWTFDQLKGTVSMSRPKLAEAVKDCILLGLIDDALPGTPFELIKTSGPVTDPRQGDMFGEV